MNTKLFFQALNKISDEYYEEAAQYSCRRKDSRHIKFYVATACLTVLVVGASLILPEAGKLYRDPASTQKEIHINMDNIYLNGIKEPVASARMWFDPALYDEAVWDKEAAMEYYGKDLTPPYVPQGLIPSSGNDRDTVITDKAGNMVVDTVWLEFYHDYYEDGSPMLTKEVAALKGFSLKASKIGILDDCVYIMPENEIVTSDIGGTDVILGYRSMPYGPYDPQTHQPAGYYDMYVAEFEHDGIHYQIVAEQIDVAEVIKITASIICGEEAVVIN